LSEYLTTEEFYKYMDGFKSELSERIHESDLKIENRLSTLEARVRNGNNGGMKEAPAVPPKDASKESVVSNKYLVETIRILLAALLTAIGVTYFQK